jgi:hypothetical protein
LDRGRDGGLDDVEAIAGAAEPPLLGDGDEGLKLPQLHALSIADHDAMKQLSALRAIVGIPDDLVSDFRLRGGGSLQW